MRVLFCISIVALIALLWASIAMVRHVQQARRRQGRALKDEATTESKDRH